MLQEPVEGADLLVVLLLGDVGESLRESLSVRAEQGAHAQHEGPVELRVVCACVHDV